MSERYAWRGGEELLLRHGEGAPLTLLILPALFEEANRMRRFTVSLMRGLADAGIGSVLPDLPGTGESLRALADVTLDDWIDATGALAKQMRAAEGRCLTVAIRGGAVLDWAADQGWRLAPETGERLLRDLVRATAFASGIGATTVDREARERPTALAGNVVSPELYQALLLAPMLSANRRTGRLIDDAGTRDVSLVGGRLWRAAEPGEDEVLLGAALGDIVDWTKTCAA